MFSQLLKFEWEYHTRKWLFLVAILGFGFFGFVFMALGVTFPNLSKNSTFIITFMTGLLSLGNIFVATVFFTNTMLRDQEHKMYELIHSTPVSKFKFLLSRFLGTYVACVIAFLFGTIGMLVGSFAPWLDPEKLEAINLINYLWPFLTIAIPNILICCAVVFLLGVITKNRIAMYVGGLFIYVLYMGGSIFSSAPWLAEASPSSTESMSLAAKIDPFGMAAFFLQSRNWSVLERNTQLIGLEGDLLFNRILWLIISFVLIGLAYKVFSFRLRSKSQKNKKEQLSKGDLVDQKRIKYQPVMANAQSFQAKWSAFLSLIKIELSAMVKGLPFLIILLFWLLLLGTEVLSSLDGGIRTSASYPHTSIIFSNILEMLPGLGIIVLIFFSNEQIWRNNTLKIDELNDSSPVNNLTLFLSKYVALAMIPLILITLSIVLGIVIQLGSGFYKIEPYVYLSIYYYAGLPLLLVAALSLFIQSLIPSKYVGMVITGLVVLVTSTVAGRMVGIRHLLLRFASTIEGQDYSDMNGLGHYVEGFHWRMLYWTAFTFLMIVLTYGLWQRGKGTGIKYRMKLLRVQIGRWGKVILLGSLLIFLSSGSYIYYQTNIIEEYNTPTEILDWRQTYEELYKPYEDLIQPTITSIKSEVDLYPSKQYYQVKANYITKNMSTRPIHKILVGVNKLVQLNQVTIDGAHPTEADHTYGYFWYELEKPLLPGKELVMSFEFESHLSQFSNHSGFNAMVENGSFIRMSRYFPYLGYTSEFEISGKDERKKRGLPEQEGIKKLEEYIAETSYDSTYNDYNFIDFETVVSTDEGQTAIAPGNLIDQWEKKNRNYFHYQVNRKIPNRFAFSSARYAVKKEDYKGINIAIYHHPEHHYNIDLMMDRIKMTLDYCQSAFGPYQYDHFRYVEISEFARGFAATAYPGSIFNNENFGFTADLTNSSKADLLTQLIAHEFSHQWWGGQLDPKTVEGSTTLVETLAQYTEIMLYEKAYGKQKALDALNVELDLYLGNRGFEKEQPLYKVNGQPHVSYSKGLRFMYLMKELVGEAKLNQALKDLLSKHAFPKTPATSIDLLVALQEIVPITHHHLLDQWFKKVILYDLKTLSGEYKELANGKYEVKLKVLTQKQEDLGLGNEAKMEVNESFKVGIFGSMNDFSNKENILHMEEYLFTGDTTFLKIIVDEKPSLGGVDPYVLMMDKDRTDNVKELKLKSN